LASTKLLVIDDELPIRKFLRHSLSEEEFDIDEAATGKEGISKVATGAPDVLILDLGLPDIDGITVVEELRTWSKVPIIVLSARHQESDKIRALDAGADDYLTKPFSVGELKARLRVALRHSKLAGEPEEAIFEAHGIRVDLSKRRVTKNGEEVHLTPNEYNMLGVLIRHSGKVVTHRQLLREVWGEAYTEEMQYLRVYAGQLRHKLEDEPARPKLLLTEPAVGYRLVTEDSVPE
jgi:two-component system KDP operon response regulator KdpE